MSESKDIHIQHAQNGGEQEVGPYTVDGYADGTVYEFHGCFRHGCPRCYARDTLNPVNDMTMSDLHQRTIEKQRYIEEKGYKYDSKWECDFDQEVKYDLLVKQFVASIEYVSPLEPRDSFAWGRTVAFTIYLEASEEDRIDYYDVTSLYPFINKTGKVPLGHPEIITENFKGIENYEGLIKCKILPPRGLYIPVLPVKINNKLMFPLCRTCAENHETDCYHTDDEWTLTGTLVTDEVKKALEIG